MIKASTNRYSTSRSPRFKYAGIQIVVLGITNPLNGPALPFLYLSHSQVLPWLHNHTPLPVSTSTQPHSLNQLETLTHVPHASPPCYARYSQKRRQGNAGDCITFLRLSRRPFRFPGSTKVGIFSSRKRCFRG